MSRRIEHIHCALDFLGIDIRIGHSIGFSSGFTICSIGFTGLRLRTATDIAHWVLGLAIGWLISGICMQSHTVAHLDVAASALKILNPFDVGRGISHHNQEQHDEVRIS